MKGSCIVPNDPLLGETANAGTADDARLAALIGELSALATEQADTARGDLDLLSTIDLVHAMNAEDSMVPAAVATQAEHIAAAVDGITVCFRRGGRLIYIGAGTAGRVGVLDASECPPTFGTDPSMVVGLIAGGPRAIQDAVENAEDDDLAAVESLRTLGLTENDAVVGISASGRTPYVLGGLQYAREVGAFTVALAANADSAIGAAAEVPIEVVVGPEFVTGSTRLKAGTSQKLVVNMLSTLSMIRLGKTYRGVMVDLRATNEKLRARSVRTLIQLTGAPQDEAVRALAEAGGSVKLALLMLFTGASAEKAAPALAEADGILRDAIAALA